MNKEDIIKLSKQCGHWSGETIEMNDVGIMDFAALVAAAEPTCPDCKAAVLYECVACSSNNYPPRRIQTESTQHMTITVLSKRIRDALSQAPDGLTPREIAVMLDVEVSQINRSLALMPDVYIDRWTAFKSKYTSVHCLAFVPDDCPHP